jgi:hypothetical protein
LKRFNDFDKLFFWFLAFTDRSDNINLKGNLK